MSENDITQQQPNAQQESPAELELVTPVEHPLLFMAN